MALDSTVGGLNSNSYATVLEAEAYFANRMHSASWTASLDQSVLLITATTMLDWYMQYRGYKANSAQALQWPRTDVTMPDGTIVDSTIIPREVKVAIFELALDLTASDVSLDNDLAGLSHVQAGPLVIKTSSGIRPAKKEAIPARIKNILRGLLVGSIGVRRLERA